jgi:hypothetical protein
MQCGGQRRGNGWLLLVGYALDFRDRRFAVTGPAGAALEGSLAGFTVPLLEALPVLATLDGPAADGGGSALPHESARAWARAARSALEAVAARRVYPALDAAGRDDWRLAGSAADDGFRDAVAEALLRPPGARLVQQAQHGLRVQASAAELEPPAAPLERHTELWEVPHPRDLCPDFLAGRNGRQEALGDVVLRRGPAHRLRAGGRLQPPVRIGNPHAVTVVSIVTNAGRRMLAHDDTSGGRPQKE